MDSTGLQSVCEPLAKSWQLLQQHPYSTAPIWPYLYVDASSWEIVYCVDFPCGYREFNPTLQEAWDNYEASQGSTVLKEGRQWAPWHNQQEPVLNPAAASAHTIGSISTHHIPYSCQAHNPAAVRTSCFQRNGSGMSFAASPASPSTPQYTMQSEARM